MGERSDSHDPWRQRAGQNLRAATLLAARHPPLHLAAVSRLYYACYQAAVAVLRARAVAIGERHGEVWSATERLEPGLGNAIWALYKWRRCADYATGPITVEEARELVAHYATLCRRLVTQEVDS